MLIIVSDATAIILLEKIELLGRLLKDFKILIPKDVEREAIIFGKERNYPDAFRLEEKVKNKMIHAVEVKDYRFVDKVMKDFNIAKGESEAICLFNQEKAQLLATDDKLAIKACKSLGIPISGTCAFVTQAFDNRVIQESEATNMIKTLAKEGRYKPEIIFNALNHISGDKNEI